ncbi:IS30 family transposase [Streptomyces sp. NPDC056069]|uniref:IS30 family transposase n=1 Tax=Streptomyces sp. NPDC056069 TaxID=3345702 RepID=UPI0035E38735
MERSTRYVMLLHLPDGRTAEHVRDALTDTVQTLPAHLRRSLTWDQGSEMARHHEVTLATALPVYFCDPASPGSADPTRTRTACCGQYFPKSTDLSVHDREHLADVAAEFNGQPRKTLGWEAPAERLANELATVSGETSRAPAGLVLNLCRRGFRSAVCWRDNRPATAWTVSLMCSRRPRWRASARQFFR